MNYVNKFDNFIEKYANDFVRNQNVVYGIVFLFLMLYSAQIAPKLPLNVLRVFDNTFFKIFIFALILWVARVSPSMAILIAVAFLMSTNVMNNKKLLEFMGNENMDDVEYEEEMDEDVEYEEMEDVEYVEEMDDVEYEEEMDEDVEYEEMEDVEYEEEMADIEY
jgi:hypothetical protein